MYSVFLADDEPWAIMALKNILDWSQYDMVVSGTALDGIEAWNRIQLLHPDILITDIKMPGMNGIDLIKQIRQADFETKVVFVSGYSDFQYAKSGIRYGCLDYLLKPLDEGELSACLIRLKNLLDEEKSIESVTPANDASVHGQYMSMKRIVNEIMEYIDTHYAEVSQQALADHYHMSSSNLCRIFRKYAGRSYTDYVLAVRIQKAEDMLLHTNFSIEEIAGLVGYADPFHFMKTFKKMTGLTPAQFRKNL